MGEAACCCRRKAPLSLFPFVNEPPGTEVICDWGWRFPEDALGLRPVSQPFGHSSHTGAAGVAGVQARVREHFRLSCVVTWGCGLVKTDLRSHRNRIF